MQPVTKSSALRIGIDGFNLSLEKDTGVEKYARTLNYTVDSTGRHSIDLDYYFDAINQCINGLLEYILRIWLERCYGY